MSERAGLSVLFVCSGNTCRSAYAKAYAVAYRAAFDWIEAEVDRL